jgi:hypothetical protein
MVVQLMQIFNRDIMNLLHLYRRRTRISSAEREKLKSINRERSKVQLCDIYDDVMLHLTSLQRSLHQL